MAIYRRDIIQILRDENDLLKIRNKQVSSKLARMQQAFRALADIDKKTRLMIEAPDLQELFHQLLHLVMHTSNTEIGSLILLDSATNELEFVEVVGETRDALMGHRISVDTGIVGRCIKTQQPILVENVQDSNQWSSSTDEYIGFHTRALMCVPLFVGELVVGAIEVVNKSSDAIFDENDLNILCAAGRLVGLALERAEHLTLLSENT